MQWFSLQVTWTKALFGLYYTVLSSIPLLCVLHRHLTNFPVTICNGRFYKQAKAKDMKMILMWTRTCPLGPLGSAWFGNVVNGQLHEGVVCIWNEPSAHLLAERDFGRHLSASERARWAIAGESDSSITSLICEAALSPWRVASSRYIRDLTLSPA